LTKKVEAGPSLLAEARVGLRGFMMIEPLRPDVGLIIAAGLRDTWSVRPYLDLLLPQVQQVAVESSLGTMVCIGNAPWLTEELWSRGFETSEWLSAFERVGSEPPPKPAKRPAAIRTAHKDDLSTIMALDRLAFDRIWHKSIRNLNEALARASSFTVASLDGRIVAYEWCEIYGQQAHLTRLAVHPDYQGRGIGTQLLYQAIVDAIEAGAELISLNTQEDNHRSRALYRRYGFVDTKRRMPVLCKELK
jgi:ribosomal-protein-alanine N-acetyltransferase